MKDDLITMHLLLVFNRSSKIDPIEAIRKAATSRIWKKRYCNHLPEVKSKSTVKNKRR